MSGVVPDRDRLLAEFFAGRLTVVSLAGALADGARALNHATAPRSGVGLASVDEVRELLASVDTLLLALPQLLRQTGAFVEDSVGACLVGVSGSASVAGDGPRAASAMLGDQLLLAASCLADARRWTAQSLVTAGWMFEVAPDAQADDGAVPR